MRNTSSVPLLRRLRRAHLRLAPPVPGFPARTAARRSRALVALARALEWLAIAGSYATLPIWPLAAAVIARDPSYVRRYPAMLPKVCRHIHGILRGRSVSRFLLQRLAPEPSAPEQVSGSCSHCGNCCLYRGCLFLSYDDAGRSRCRIYGGRLWNLLACGDYPASARDISLYECPSFAALPLPVRKPVIIPIVSAGYRPASAANSPVAVNRRHPRQRAAASDRRE